MRNNINKQLDVVRIGNSFLVYYDQKIIFSSSVYSLDEATYRTKHKKEDYVMSNLTCLEVISSIRALAIRKTCVKWYNKHINNLDTIKYPTIHYGTTLKVLDQ